MKIVLILVVSILAIAVSYFLYQISLGSIPFLIASLILFYLGHKMILKSSNKDDEKFDNEECPDKIK